MTQQITYYGGPWDGITKPHPNTLPKNGSSHDVEYMTVALLDSLPCVYEIFGDIAMATSEETTHRILAEEWR